MMAYHFSQCIELFTQILRKILLGRVKNRGKKCYYNGDFPLKTSDSQKITSNEISLIKSTHKENWTFSKNNICDK
jgi:hypothetical protein